MSRRRSRPANREQPHLPHLRVNQAFVSKVHASLQQGHIVLVQGETGCGKSVRLPRLLMEMGMSPILCAQPRRLAARSIAHRVAEELGQPLGQRVGYQIGQRRVATAQTELLFVTAGIVIDMLRTRGAGTLADQAVLVLDEVHERSVENDLVLCCVRELLKSGVNIKLVLMSATLDAERCVA